MNLKKFIEHTDPDVKYTSLVLLSENGIGSLLHAFKIPLAGHLLSINQIGIINKATFETKDSSIALRISLGGSLLKSLSPAGKKLTPMLAILAQGVFYNLPIKILGINPISALLGIIFSSLWAFIQPFLFLYIFFGNDLYLSFEKITKDLNPYLPNLKQYILIVIALMIFIKIILSILYSFFIFKNESFILSHLQKHSNNLQPRTIKRKTNNPLILALLDLLNPLFIFSFILTAIYFYFMESDRVHLIWNCVRPLAIAYLTFYLIRIFPMDNLTSILIKNGFSKTANAISTLKDWTKEINQQE